MEYQYHAKIYAKEIITTGYYRTEAEAIKLKDNTDGYYKSVEASWGTHPYGIFTERVKPEAKRIWAESMEAWYAIGGGND